MRTPTVVKPLRSAVGKPQDILERLCARLVGTAKVEGLGTVPAVQPLTIALGETDCEAIRDGFLAQPVNALSSLAFSLVGLVLLGWAARATATERAVRYAFVVAMVATGLGSFLYHGPQTPGSGFLHDITFLVALLIIGLANLSTWRGWPSRRLWVVLVVLTGLAAVVLALYPTVTNVLTAIAVVILLAGDLGMHRVGGIDGRWYAVALGSLAMAFVFFLIGRTGSPLCDPDTVIQGHGAWHVFSAVFLGAYAVATGSVRTVVETT